jgi:hypothetical protein
MEINAVDYLSKVRCSKDKTISSGKSRERNGSHIEIFEVLNDFIIKHMNQGYFSHLFFNDATLLKSVGMPYSTFIYKLTKLEKLGILTLTNKSSYKSSEATEFYVNKTKFVIHYFLKIIFDSMGEKIKRSLKYRKCNSNYDLISLNLFNTITENKPLPIHFSVQKNDKAKKLEEQVINTIYYTFFQMFNEYFSLNNKQFKTINKTYHTPIFKYWVDNISPYNLDLIYPQSWKQGDNVSFCFFSLIGNKLTDKKYLELSDKWFVNNVIIEKPDCIFEDNKYKFSLNYLMKNKDFIYEVPDSITYSYDNQDLFTLGKIEITSIESVEYLSNEENRSKVAENYAKYLVGHSKLIMLYAYLDLELRKYASEIPSTLNISITHKVDNDSGELLGYELKASTRAYSHFGKEEKELRNILLENNWGGVDHYDIKSCSFNIIRLINKGVFDFDWGLKELIESRKYPILYQKDKFLTKKDLKTLIYLILNNRSSDIQNVDNILAAISIDRENKSRDPFYTRELPDLDKATIIDISNLVQLECGNWKLFKDNIFILESILELGIRLAMNKKGYFFENIYDCLYFNPNQITRKKFLKLINSTVLEFYKGINKLNKYIKIENHLNHALEKNYYLYFLKATSWSSYTQDYLSFNFNNKNLDLQANSELGFNFKSEKTYFYLYFRNKNIIYRHYDKKKKTSTFSIDWYFFAEALKQAFVDNIITISDVTIYINRIIKYQSNSLCSFELGALRDVLSFGNQFSSNYSPPTTEENN